MELDLLQFLNYEMGNPTSRTFIRLEQLQYFYKHYNTVNNLAQYGSSIPFDSHSFVLEYFFLNFLHLACVCSKFLIHGDSVVVLQNLHQGCTGQCKSMLILFYFHKLLIFFYSTSYH